MNEKGMALWKLMVTLAAIGIILIPVYLGGVYLVAKVVKWAWQ